MIHTPHHPKALLFSAPLLSALLLCAFASTALGADSAPVHNQEFTLHVQGKVQLKAVPVEVYASPAWVSTAQEDPDKPGTLGKGYYTFETFGGDKINVDVGPDTSMRATAALINESTSELAAFLLPSSSGWHIAVVGLHGKELINFNGSSRLSVGSGVASFRQKGPLSVRGSHELISLQQTIRSTFYKSAEIPGLVGRGTVLLRYGTHEIQIPVTDHDSLMDVASAIEKTSPLFQTRIVERDEQYALEITATTPEIVALYRGDGPSVPPLGTTRFAFDGTDTLVVQGGTFDTDGEGKYAFEDIGTLSVEGGWFVFDDDGQVHFFGTLCSFDDMGTLSFKIDDHSS